MRRPRTSQPARELEKSLPPGVVLEFRCPEGRRHFARITAEASAVRYEWQDRERHVGRVLLSCRAKPKLEKPATFSLGYRYF